jgi:hypothetical protein
MGWDGKKQRSLNLQNVSQINPDNVCSESEEPRNLSDKEQWEHAGEWALCTAEVPRRELSNDRGDLK